MNFKKTHNPYFNIVILFIITRVVLFGLSYWVTKGNLRLAFDNFDVEQYLSIARNGYEVQTTAFFPLIPLIMKFFDFFNMPIVGTMLVNNVAILFAAILLYKLTNNSMSVKLFLCSPIAVFTFIAYTESLFLLLTFLVLYLYKNEKYLLAGIILGLSVACRSLAAMLFFAIFIVMAIKFFKKKISFKPILSMYIPATLISVIYPIYLQLNFGNWKLFMDVQYTHWHRMSSNIVLTIIKDFEYIFSQDSPLQQAQAVYHTILFIALIVLIGFACKKVLKTKNEMDAIAILYLALSLFCIYSSCRIPSIGMPTASFYRYFYGCTAVYTLPAIFNSEKFNKFKHTKLFIIEVFLSLCFACAYFMNLFMC